MMFHWAVVCEIAKTEEFARSQYHGTHFIRSIRKEKILEFLRTCFLGSVDQDSPDTLKGSAKRDNWSTSSVQKKNHWLHWLLTNAQLVISLTVRLSHHTKFYTIFA